MTKVNTVFTSQKQEDIEIINWSNQLSQNTKSCYGLGLVTRMGEFVEFQILVGIIITWLNLFYATSYSLNFY